MDLEALSDKLANNIQNAKAEAISERIINNIDFEAIEQNIENKLDLESIAKSTALNIAMSLEKSAKEHLRDCKNLLEAFKTDKYEYFLDLIRKTQIYASQNLLAISNAITLIQNSALQAQTFEFEQNLAAKKAQYLAKYKNLEKTDNLFIVS